MKWIWLITAAVVFASSLLLAGCRKPGGIENDPGANDPGSSAGTPSIDAPRAQISATLRFDSFDGGGPAFSAKLADEGIVGVDSYTRYAREDHDQLDGAAFDAVFDFYGIRAGETTLTIEERSPLIGNYDRVYRVTVDDALQVTLEELYTNDLDAEASTGTPVLAIDLGIRTIYANFADNDAARALIDQMQNTNFGLFFEDLGGYAKSTMLGGDEIAREDTEQQVRPGDVVLLRNDEGDDCFCICYAEQTVTCSVLAHIELTADELLELFGAAEYTEGLMWLEYGE